MTQTTKSNHGGKRANAGRPPKYANCSRMVKTTVNLPPEWKSILKAEFGSVNGAVEHLVKEYLWSNGREEYTDLSGGEA